MQILKFLLQAQKKSKKTRLYGNSFDNSTKKVNGLDSSSPFHGYVPIKKIFS